MPVPDAVELSRVVRAPPDAVEAFLTPERVVEFEGALVPRDVSERDGRVVVTSWPHGRLLAPTVVFEDREDGFTYRREGHGRPLVASETVVTVGPAPDGAELTVRSTVDPSLPLPLAGRVAAWNRRRALERLLDRTEAALEDG